MSPKKLDQLAQEKRLIVARFIMDNEEPAYPLFFIKTKQNHLLNNGESMDLGEAMEFVQRYPETTWKDV